MRGHRATSQRECEVKVKKNMKEQREYFFNPIKLRLLIRVVGVVEHKKGKKWQVCSREESILLCS
jgi:hypothetical protein